MQRENKKRFHAAKQLYASAQLDTSASSGDVGSCNGSWQMAIVGDLLSRDVTAAHTDTDASCHHTLRGSVLWPHHGIQECRKVSHHPDQPRPRALPASMCMNACVWCMRSSPADGIRREQTTWATKLLRSTCHRTAAYRKALPTAPLQLRV